MLKIGNEEVSKPDVISHGKALLPDPKRDVKAEEARMVKEGHVGIRFPEKSGGE